jgi:hypothetical protein
MKTHSIRAGLACAASLVIAVMAGASCETNADANGFGGGPGSAASSSVGGAGGAGGVGQGGVNFDGGQGGEGGDAPCISDPGDDLDKDGYNEDEGDCDDCDSSRSPSAVEVISADPNAAKADEDCDGAVDELDATCDAGLAIDDSDPLSGARAIDLCKQSAGPTDWGVVSVQWVVADGSPPPQKNLAAFHLGHGMLPGFGPNVAVRRGERLLGLSSGAARRPNDPGYHDVHGFDKLYEGAHPEGFPKESPACPGNITGEPHDDAGLEIKIRTPPNAQGFSFDFNFYTYEWPEYVCSEFNDFFVALLSPTPTSQSDGNISFDTQGNPVSVNNAFLDVCGCAGNPPGTCIAGGKTFPCALGDAELVGTGFGFDTAFEDHGATSWLVTKAPVEPSTEMVIRFSVYDSGDGVLDSTTLIDNWTWIGDPGTIVGTIPIPE